MNEYYTNNEIEDLEAIEEFLAEEFLVKGVK